MWLFLIEPDVTDITHSDVFTNVPGETMLIIDTVDTYGDSSDFSTYGTIVSIDVIFLC